MFYLSIESELAKSAEASNICVSSQVEANIEFALVTGLVNTGNSCFMNSVLQALSSLPHLHIYLEHVSHTVPNGVPLPVIRSLLKTIRTLTKPLNRRSSIRPTDIVTALSSNRRIISREQQDAQEFFQLVASAMEVEGHRTAITERIGGGLKDLLRPKTLKGYITRSACLRRQQQRNIKMSSNIHGSSSKLENPLTGLLANRLSCMQCGYTGAIRHFTFNNIQLNVPRKYTATLEECLSEFTEIEYLQDASCRRCSFETTIRQLSVQIEALQHELKRSNNLRKKSKSESNISSSNKKKKELLTQIVHIERIKEKIINRLKAGRIDEDDDGDQANDRIKLPLVKSISRMSTKQVMLAKPPKILCLHINRSAFHTTGAVYKNACRIIYPEYLDMSPFCTNGTLHTQPNIPISTPSNDDNTTLIRSRRRGAGGNLIYRLMSVIVHYGSHSFGHFVTYKRRIYTKQCKCHECHSTASYSAMTNGEEWKCQNVWYRISDTKVDECSIDDVMRANPYMLLYELIDEDSDYKKKNNCLSTDCLVETELQLHEEASKNSDNSTDWSDENGEGQDEESTNSSSTSNSGSSAVTTDKDGNHNEVYDFIQANDASVKEALHIANSLIHKHDVLLAAHNTDNLD
ncbi:hypothetical protein BDF20DRAFT_234404 [Mycotypha africana]|uniref:uncharacterized protein n=1 Tax=Mycotypha africana TaxID=64632 RepID=UPI002300A2DA|nr:uncharacterized protein BDF20DRAFT_234404 [Mycotypha africana]KAI8967424.1 hypothetical protein BDF20DRAFT_234404 [Mycotypha africana]